MDKEALANFPTDNWYKTIYEPVRFRQSSFSLIFDLFCFGMGELNTICYVIMFQLSEDKSSVLPPSDPLTLKY